MSMSGLLARTSTTYVALPQFDGLKNSIITILGSVVMIILVIRIVTAYGKKQYGEIITEIIAVIFVAWFVFTPDSAQTTIVSLAKTIFGKG